MTNYDLSILIPARNEMFLAKTIENILANIEGDTEVIIALDGAWANPPVPQNERVTIVYHNESIGQRAATNEAVRLSKAKYLMKCDAHCAFDKGFDVKMIAEMHDDWTMVPLMKNLHAFDWVCPNGHRRYQGPSGPCKECGKETVRDIMWQAKPSPNSVSYCFDSSPHFQYFGEYAKRPEGQGEITETMSLQGSCWMLTRDKYWELGVCDEAFGGWGSQGIEVAVKTWLSGGKVMVNKKTWYAHMFRTQGGDFGFPYPISGRDQEKAKSFARDLFFNNKWDKQIHPLSWLIEKFWPVKGWTDEDLKKLKANTFKFSESTSTPKPVESEPTNERPIVGIIYDAYRTSDASHKKFGTTPISDSKGIIFYTDNQLKIKIAHRVQNQLRKISAEKHIPIVSASLKPMPHFGSKNIFFPHLKRGYLTMSKQILEALENSTAEIIFFTEHDVYYSEKHFDFIPPHKDVFYYNVNVWRTRLEDGHSVKTNNCRQLSGLCAYRDLLLEHYKKRVKMLEDAQSTMSDKEFSKYVRGLGFEPGTHNRATRVDDYKSEAYESKVPNIDIRHEGTLTPSRWNKDQFRNQRFTEGWTESEGQIPGWGDIKPILNLMK